MKLMKQDEETFGSTDVIDFESEHWKLIKMKRSKGEPKPIDPQVN